MPHKINESNSTLSSSDSNSSGDQVVVVPNLRGTNSAGLRKSQPPVVIHNHGGQTYDETRTADWDRQRWK
ncbi:hypothetical protein BJX76DRAFT_358277 [Aspergillus varians]